MTENQVMTEKQVMKVMTREHVMQTRKTLDVNRLENWALINVNLIVKLFMWSGH